MTNYRIKNWEEVKIEIAWMLKSNYTSLKYPEDFPSKCLVEHKFLPPYFEINYKLKIKGRRILSFVCLG